MNNEEIEYWNSFLKTIDFLPIRGENDYNFMDRLRRVVSLHINRLERVILVDGKEYVTFPNTVPYLLISCLYANSPTLYAR